MLELLHAHAGEFAKGGASLLLLPVKFPFRPAPLLAKNIGQKDADLCGSPGLRQRRSPLRLCKRETVLFSRVAMIEPLVFGCD